MAKVENLKKQLAELESSLSIMDAEEKKMVQEGIDQLKAQIAKEKGKSEPAKKTKAPSKKAEKPDCNELAEAWEKRRKAAKTSAGKKTAPIMKRAADGMEKIVRAGIQYNKDKGGDLHVEKLKEAVKSMTEALDMFKEALNGEFEDTYIDNFKRDMLNILKAVEKKAKS
jgi:hypothetical protein